MVLLATSVLLVLLVSALCSLSEAALYAVQSTYVRGLESQGTRVGAILAAFKSNMERPISAILIVNTVANTAGAAIAGGQAERVFGGNALVWFSLCFTVAVLLFSEILPKVTGVVYSRLVSRLVAFPLQLVVMLLAPFIWCVHLLTNLVKPDKPVFSAPEDEVLQLAQISAEEGSILPIEAELVKNVLALNDVKARDICTPRTVVVRLPENITVAQAAGQVKEWTFARIPVYLDDDPDVWTGQVLRRDVLNRLANDLDDTPLRSLAKPLHCVPEHTRGHELLSEFIRRRSHLFGVIDEYGNVVGVVTLEDVLESLIGKEIVDEVDAAVDLREVARRKFGQLDATGGTAPTSTAAGPNTEAPDPAARATPDHAAPADEARPGDAEPGGERP